MVAAAFVVAVERRFREGNNVADDATVIDFIASVRARSDDSAHIVNPEVAESIILTLLGRGSVDTIDGNTLLEHQIILLAALVSQAQFEGSELDAFMAEAAALADQVLE
ncbi:hypothetical protein ACFQY7_20530 [Actinomadura luteofluorescens]|uniref:hypothetical protein n=1 Tax=Actinomadura luteofluorescens TaxID=46163 RepID=UPI00362D165E